MALAGLLLVSVTFKAAVVGVLRVTVPMVAVAPAVSRTRVGFTVKPRAGRFVLVTVSVAVAASQAQRGRRDGHGG